MVGTHLLPAGVASVFGPATPIVLTLFAWVALREPLGAALAPGASASWATGSLWSGRLRLPRDPAVLLATRLVASAARLTAVAGATGAAGRVDFAHLPANAWRALAYLVVASTLIGYAAFLAVNADVSPTVANSFCYAAPVVALLLSAALPGEPLTLPKLLASGVALMVRGAGRRRRIGGARILDGS